MRITSTCTVSTVVLNEELGLGNDGIPIARNVDACTARHVTAHRSLHALCFLSVSMC